MSKRYEFDFDFEALEAALYSDLAKSFTILQLELPDESIYNFTLGISNDIGYVTTNVMTESGLIKSVTNARERWERYRNVDFDILMVLHRHDATEDVYHSDEYAHHDFWGMLAASHDLLGQLLLKTDELTRNELLFAPAELIELWDYTEEVQSRVLDICEQVMMRLDEAKIFELTNRRENVTLQVRRGDNEPDPEIVRRLNPHEVYEKFLIHHQKYLAARKLVYGY